MCLEGVACVREAQHFEHQVVEHDEDERLVRVVIGGRFASVVSEQAEIGVLISLREPTQLMRTEAASAGFYTSPWGQHPKIQLLTIAELLAGKRIDMPAGGAHMTQVALPPTPEAAVHPDQLSLGT